MRLSHCVLHKECAGCTDGVRYTARFYAEPVEVEEDFNKLPPFIGCCNLRIQGIDVYVTCLVMMVVEVEGKRYGYTFDNKYRLDLIKELLLIEPKLTNAYYERHRPSTLTPHHLHIPRQLHYLTRTTTQST